MGKFIDWRKQPERRPKVTVAIPCSTERSNWLNPFLTANLVMMARDPRFHMEFHLVLDVRAYDYARNVCVKLAREDGADYLFMIDNDQSFPLDVNPLDILHAGLGKDVIGLPTVGRVIRPSDKPGRPPFTVNYLPQEAAERSGDFFSVAVIGTGAMFISSRVWEKIPGPWFRSYCDENSELLENEAGEDRFFCELAKRHDFKLWAYFRLILQHWKTAEITMLGGRSCVPVVEIEE